MTINGIVRGLNAAGSVLDGYYVNKGRMKSVRLVNTLKLKYIIGKTQQKIVRQVFSELAVYQVCTDY